MNPAEALKPGSSPPLETPSKPEAASPVGKKEKRSGVDMLDRLKTYVGDLVRDVDTANQMARDKFNGDSALMHAAKGSLPLLFGLGSEYVFNDALAKATKSGKLHFNRLPVFLSKQTIDKLEELGQVNPRGRYFLESAIKDALIGLTYNSAAHFSGRALDPAEAKHFLGSLAISALDALGPNGKAGVKIANGVQIPKEFPEDKNRKRILLETEIKERTAQYNALPTAQEAEELARSKWKNQPKNTKDALDKEWTEATNANNLWQQYLREKEAVFAQKHNGIEAPENLRLGWLDQFIENHREFDPKVIGKTEDELKEILPKRLMHYEVKAMNRSNEEAVIAEGIAAQKRLREAARRLLVAYNRLKRINAAKDILALPNSQKFSLQSEAIKLLKYANPPVLKGLEDIIGGLKELVVNVGEVQKVRKEKGGLPGKRVEMPRKGQWQDRGEKPWQRYGSSHWQDRKLRGR